ncbi:Protein RTM1 [Fusarium odoratissimum]|uniref:Protein RTM1 n=1 Tax=Fusarium oxysporum f. sp. cubense (strain race 4) TaxID=2502994 RepID=N1SA79_FUSC4|nr:Protein RTM1 [Fusarium odoratissimum]
MVLYAISFGFHILHIIQFWKLKLYFFLPFLAGVLCEAIGFCGRTISAAESPDYTNFPYVTQHMLLLIGPTCYFASLYMTIGQLIQVLDAEQYSPIKPKWLTKGLLVGDLLAMILQAVATDSKYAARRREGENILAVGFAVQILFLILFMAISGIFQHRAAKGLPLRSCSPAINWRKYLLVNHIANMFILVRSIYHLIGYGQGYNGELRSTKAYFYAFDALLMLVVSVIFNIFHPLTYVNEAKNRTDSQIPLAYTNGVP